MNYIQISYNPFKLETDVKLSNGEVILKEFTNLSFDQWIITILPKLVEQLGESKFKILFTGTLYDYDDLVAEVNKFNNEQGTSISIDHIKLINSETEFYELKSLIKEAQESIEIFKEEKIQSKFDKILNTEVDIAVIANMSAGKSTLINALLGRELMPSDVTACTSKITKIFNTTSDEFSAEIYNEQGDILNKFSNFCLNDMKRCNEEEEISHVLIKGNFPNIVSNDLNLVLIDTPGPNNSQNQQHREYTYKLLTSDHKPLILYVLNARDYQTDDNRNLLQKVAEETKKQGKISSERFLFVINQMDIIDSEKNNIGEFVADVEQFIKDQGIKNPLIYPVSAELAKQIRTMDNGAELSRRERMNFDHLCSLFIEDEQMHLNKYSSLTTSMRQKLEEKLALYRESKEIQKEALFHTGIHGVEAAINRHLQKYAMIEKTKEAIQEIFEVMRSHNNSNSSNSKSSATTANILGLTLEQTRLLYSYQYFITNSDILAEKDLNIRNKKRKWLNNWKETVESTLKPLAYSVFNEIIASGMIEVKDLRRVFSELTHTEKYAKILLSKNEIEVETNRLQLMSKNLNTPFYLILLELTLFNAYYPLNPTKKSDYKNLKLNETVNKSNLLQCATLLKIPFSYVDKYKETYKKSIRNISGFWNKILIGGIAGAVIIGVTGGLAAPFIAGLAAPAGLAGAAAINAGLAALGGGAIAAGGFGMAGGMAVIVGGGTILGITSGGAAGALLSSSSDFALQQAAKLEVVMKEIILFAQKDVRYAQEILKQQRDFIEAQEMELLRLKRNEQKHAEQIKTLKKSIEYLRKAYDQNKAYVEGA
jgi:predicted GTPase